MTAEIKQLVTVTWWRCNRLLLCEDLVFNEPSDGSETMPTGSVGETGVARQERGVASVPTVGEHVEGLASGVQAGQAGGFGGDGPPALQRCLQGRRPVGDHTQCFAPHQHHLRPLWPRLVGVGLLDCRGQGGGGTTQVRLQRQDDWLAGARANGKEGDGRS